MKNIENNTSSIAEETLSVLYFILGALFYLCDWKTLMWISFIKGFLDMICSFYLAYKKIKNK